MENIKEHKPNYKIYYFDDDHFKKIVVDKFHAENDHDAYVYLEAFRKTSVEHKDKQLYYSKIYYASMIKPNGNRSEEYDMEDIDARRRLIDDELWFKRIAKNIKFNLHYWLIDRPRDFKYWIRDIIYLLKNKEAYSNQWNLDWHLIDSIERNVPSLIENSHALAFIDEAIYRRHGNEPEFDIDEFHRKYYAGYPSDLEDLAMKIQKEEYSNLLLYVKLYKYYAGFGDIDFNNPDEVEIDKKYRSTLPIKPGTYDEISDYKKAMSLTKKYWDKIWDWMKAYGEKLND